MNGIDGFADKRTLECIESRFQRCGFIRSYIKSPMNLDIDDHQTQQPLIIFEVPLTKST